MIWIIVFLGCWLLGLTAFLWWYTRSVQSAVEDLQCECGDRAASLRQELHEQRHAATIALHQQATVLTTDCQDRHQRSLQRVRTTEEMLTGHIEENREATLDQFQHVIRTILTAEDVLELATHVLAVHIVQKVMPLPDDQAPQVNIHELAHSNFLKR